MSDIIIPNQPINFKFCDHCDCLGVECANQNHIAEFTDTFSFQVENSELFLSDELFVNLAGTWIGDFEDAVAGIFGASGWQNTADGGGSDWNRSNVAPLDGTWSGRSQTESNIAGNTETLTGKFATGDYIRLQVLHSAMAADCDLNIYYTIGAGYVLLTTIEGAADEETFTYIFENTFGDITGFGFKYTAGCTGEGWRAIDNVSVKKYDFSAFKIYECCVDNNLISALDSTKFVVESDGIITFEDDWDNYLSVNGLYKICIDDVNLVYNGTFDTNLDEWLQTGAGVAWTWVTNSANANLALQSSAELYQVVDLPAKCDFTLDFGITANAPDVVGYVDVYINHVLYLGGYSIGNQSIAVTSRNEPITSIGFVATSTSGVFGFDCFIDNVEIITDLCSNCIEFDTEHDCSLYLTATQTNDAFGFDFTDFTLYQRFFADLFKYTPEFDQVNNKSSAGVNTQVFADLQRTYELKIYRMPAYLWNAIEVMSILNTFKIDGITYVKSEGTIELDWDARREFASGTINVVKGTENNLNTYS